MARQRSDQLAKTFIARVQAVIARIQLLALSIVDAQVEGVAVDILISILRAMAKVFESLQAFEAWQAAHHRQDSRVKSTNELSRLFYAQRPAPQGEQLDQFIDEILARFPSEGHYGHGAQLETQIVHKQHDSQHQRRRLASARAGYHRR